MNQSEAVRAIRRGRNDKRLALAAHRNGQVPQGTFTRKLEIDVAANAHGREHGPPVPPEVALGFANVHDTVKSVGIDGSRDFSPLLLHIALGGAEYQS